MRDFREVLNARLFTVNNWSHVYDYNDIGDVVTAEGMNDVVGMTVGETREVPDQGGTTVKVTRVA